MKFLKNRSYYFKIFFSIIIILIIFTVSLVTDIYFNMRSYVKKTENNKSELVLSQMRYNLEYINNMIRDICTSVYYSSSAKVLMYFEGDETYDEMSLINQLDNLRVQKNPLIHSIHVYNNNKKNLYSTYHAFKIRDDTCMEIIKNTYPLPVLKPIVRTFTDDLTGQSTKVASYFMYDLTDSENIMDGGIVVNVDIAWLMQSLVELNKLSNINEKAFIYSARDHSFLSSDSMSYETNEEMTLIKGNLDKLSDEWLQKKENTISFFDVEHGNSEITVWYEPIKNTDWVLVKAQSNLTYSEYFSQISDSLFGIVGIALVLAILAYYMVSRRLYSPVRSIINMIPKDSRANTSDEFEIIHRTFEQYNQELDILKSKYNSYSEIVKSFFLRRLLLDNQSVRIKDIYGAEKEQHFSIDLEKPLSICLIKLNEYKKIDSDNFLHDAGLAKFAVQNIASEITGNHFPCELIDMEGDYFVMIQNSGKCTQEELKAIFEEVQQICLSVLKISLAITISSTIPNFVYLTDLYNKTAHNSNYRVIFGNHSVIYDELILGLKLSNNANRALKFEDKLINELSEPMDIVLRNINMLFEEIAGLEYNSIVYSIVCLQRMVIDEINHINRATPEAIITFPPVLNINILETNTLGEIKEDIVALITEIKSKYLSDTKQSKSSSLALQAKEIIDNEYSDIDLNASRIAEALKVSSTKLSSIFNRYMNMSIPEYLNTVRLLKAVDLLQNSDYSITTIMQMIGINNESYFYRIFKNKYKMTPREYVAAARNERG